MATPTTKTSNAVFSTRSASCSRGWLRLIVEGIFGIIIVSSFILILLMAIGTTYKNQFIPPRRCLAEGCRVVCNDAPFFGKFEDHVHHALKDTEPDCGRIFLTLNQSMFNNFTLPTQWFSAIRTDVTDLEIIGGNLQHIPSGAFMSQFGHNIRVLVLVKITITTLAADTFLGLSALQELFIKDCLIINIRQNALQAIDDTLQILKINSENYWNPVNITGSSSFLQLHDVDFSRNEFNDILGRDSFTELKVCRVLYLNLCKITAIGAGAFDYLESIKILHLHDNYLVTLPHDLFKKIIPLKPRISLQKNLWRCDCLCYNLRTLTRLNLIIVDPICEYPIAYRGKTFSEFEEYCSIDSFLEFIHEDHIYDENTIINLQCESNSSADNLDVQLRSPMPEYKCNSNKIHRPIETNISIDNFWIKPTFSIDTNGFSMLGLAFSGSFDYGLMWYKSSCPNEIYCINHLPTFLRVYNKDPNIEYTFCLVTVSSGTINSVNCVIYNQASLQTSVILYKSVLLFVGIAIACLLSGAVCIYALIHRNPILLKGNKRLVFVKHKTVDALILPPKLSLRCNITLDSNKSTGNKNNIFVIPENSRTRENFNRNNSIRTIESSDPSYISALQPTEDQLAEWRITRHFAGKYIKDTTDSNMSTQCAIDYLDSLPYYSLDSNTEIYESIKL